jgi:hypothetical protein
MFDNIHIRVGEDTDGALGRSAMRNQMAEGIPDEDWLFFLDADDLMHPNAIREVTESDGDKVAVWGLILEYQSGCVLERFQIPWVESYEDLVRYDPYMTLQMGHFIKKGAWRPFNESMDVGEDWEYYLRIWKEHDGHCIKQAGPMMVNVRGQHSTGPRSGNGRQWRDVVMPLMQAALEEVMPKIETPE